MGRNCKNAVSSSTIAIGIKGDRHSLCGAIKRFERSEKRFNNFLSLKERCARHIALMKNEQIKSFITGYLPTHLFTYVTKDIFNLRSLEFRLNYPKPFYMCVECAMDSCEDPSDTRLCPNIEDAIEKLNQHFFKTQQRQQQRGNKTPRFELIYRVPNDDDTYDIERRAPASFFLYLSPAQYENDDDDDSCYGSFERYYSITSNISPRIKLLFVDVMRFFGGFKSDSQEPQVIFYRRCEYMF